MFINQLQYDPFCKSAYYLGWSHYIYELPVL